MKIAEIWIEASRPRDAKIETTSNLFFHDVDDDPSQGEPKMKTPRTLRAWLVLVALSVCCVPFMACKITVVESTDDAVCGDGVCDADEDGDSCAADCAVAPVAVCGDGACDEGEGLTTCAEDCVPEVGYDVTRAPVGVSGLLSQDVINEMLDTGMNLYEGNAPPSVVGRYELNSLEVLFDGWLERANTETNIMSYELDISEEGGVLMACQYQADSGGSECSVSA